MFLSSIETGSSVEEANEIAMHFNTETVNAVVIQSAKNRCRFDHNGSQLEMIATAKRAGFSG